MDPEQPDRDTCEMLLAELAKLVAAGGWERFARPPVVPGAGAFPDPYEATPAGVGTIARRLIAHAGEGDLAVTIVDRRAEAGRGPQDKKVPTELELTSVEERRARFDLYSIGDDEVAGTIAHEVGTALAARWQTPDAPYRGVVASVIDRDARWRGSIAAVYAGLGVLAANAAFQEYKLGRYQAHLGYAPVDYEIVKAGQLTVDEIAYLVAVQAIVRDGVVPKGLGGVQTDVVRAWIDALRDRAGELRAMLGVPDPAPPLARDAPGALPPASELVVAGDVEPPPRRVFRMPSTRAGLGVLVGMVALGVGAGAVGAGRGAIPIVIAGGAIAGAAIGSRSRLDRCSSCVHVLPSGSVACPHCGGEIAGLLTSRADALDVE
ncbi:MAG TPA: hypothetical protein VL463_06685 [Kofleriaceae bacterium]|nr:hypothetical protein [Kofleriaceae bacterium]